jgi:hypothetical protein
MVIIIIVFSIIATIHKLIIICYYLVYIAFLVSKFIFIIINLTITLIIVIITIDFNINIEVDFLVRILVNLTLYYFN